MTGVNGCDHSEDAGVICRGTDHYNNIICIVVKVFIINFIQSY